MRVYFLSWFRVFCLSLALGILFLHNLRSMNSLVVAVVFICFSVD